MICNFIVVSLLFIVISMRLQWNYNETTMIIMTCLMTMRQNKLPISASFVWRDLPTQISLDRQLFGVFSRVADIGNFCSQATCWRDWSIGYVYIHYITSTLHYNTSHYITLRHITSHWHHIDIHDTYKYHAANVTHCTAIPHNDNTRWCSKQPHPRMRSHIHSRSPSHSRSR